GNRCRIGIDCPATGGVTRIFRRLWRRLSLTWRSRQRIPFVPPPRSVKPAAQQMTQRRHDDPGQHRYRKRGQPADQNLTDRGRSWATQRSPAPTGGGAQPSGTSEWAGVPRSVAMKDENGRRSAAPLSQCVEHAGKSSRQRDVRIEKSASEGSEKIGGQGRD